jgi:hypothetical protein
MRLLVEVLMRKTFFSGFIQRQSQFTSRKAQDILTALHMQIPLSIHLLLHRNSERIIWR